MADILHLRVKPRPVAPECHVLIQGNEIAGYKLAIVPPDAEPIIMSPAVDFITYEMALASARLLRLERGWPIVDERGTAPPPRAA